MVAKNKMKEDSEKSLKTVPFKDAEEAWFWFIAAQEARLDGARFAAGQSLMPRPCEPVDILKVLDRLYRNRRLLRDHLLVLRHYGRRHMPPDERRPKEMCAFRLWHEALERIGEVLERKGIVEPPSAQHKNWIGESLRMETAAGWEVAAE
jgi:hypothetical protein